MKKSGIFLFVISPLVPEIFQIFALCKLGTDDIRRCDSITDFHGHVMFTSFQYGGRFCGESPRK